MLVIEIHFLSYKLGLMIETSFPKELNEFYIAYSFIWKVFYLVYAIFYVTNIRNQQITSYHVLKA